MPVLAAKAAEAAVLVDRHTAGCQDLAPRTHEPVGTEVGIVVIVPAAGQTRLERGLELEHGVTVVPLGRAVERFGKQAVGLRVGVHLIFQPVDKEEPFLLPLALQPLALDQLAIQVQRRFEQRLDAPAGIHHVAVVAPQGEMDEPRPERRVHAELDCQRRVFLEERC